MGGGTFAWGCRLSQSWMADLTVRHSRDQMNGDFGAGPLR